MDATNSVSITGGGYTAQISLLGGQLLNLTHREDELIVPAAKTEGAFAGAVLAPWPNRTKGGSYTYAGVEHMLPVNEEATGAALHGLLLDLPLRVISEKESEVRLQGWLESSEGYPFGLDIALTYRVSAGIGLAATLMARYRPEELDEPDAPETETPLAGPDDTVPDDASAEASDLEDSEGGSDDDASSGSESEEAESASLSADQGDSAAGGSGTPDGEAAEDEAEEGEAAEGEDAVSDIEDQPSAATVADAEIADTAAADVEPADADATDDAASPSEAADAADRDAADTDTISDDSAIESTPVPQTAPFGAGFHPYLSAGGASLKECRLRLPAQMMLKTKADGTVTGRKRVPQDFDLTNAPLLAGRIIDHAFTDLPEEGWTAELIHGPSGFVVRMIADTPWVQVYTGERIDRAGVAIEPMTCPPNALNSGEDLIHLVPGKWFRMGYSIEAIRAD